MSTAWETEHRRNAVLRSVIGRLDAGGDGELQWDQLPDAAVAFRDRDDLLLALQRRWYVALSARIEELLETGSGDLPADVTRAWRDLAADLPGLRRVLDRHAEAPVLRHALREEQQLLAVAAGLASFDTPVGMAAEAGAALVMEYRARRRRTPLDIVTGLVRGRRAAGAVAS